MSLLITLLVIQRLSAKFSKRSSLSIQMPDDKIWKESSAADDEFLDHSTSLFNHHDPSKHFSGILSMNDLTQKRPAFDDDGKHPVAEEESGKYDFSSSAWAKKLLLDHGPNTRTRSRSSKEPEQESSDPIQVRCCELSSSHKSCCDLESF